MTVEAFIPVFVECHLKKKADYRSRSCILKHYFPPLYACRLADLSPHDVEQWFYWVKDECLTNMRKRGEPITEFSGQGQANAAVSLLRVMFKQAQKRGYVDHQLPDPTRFVQLHHLPGRDVIIEEHEMPHVLQTILAQEHIIQTALLGLLTTDSRPGEILRMRWEDLQFWTERDQNSRRQVWCGRWCKGKTKNGLVQQIPLPTMLVERLRQIPQTGEWVFMGVEDHCRRKAPGPMSYSHFSNRWEDIRIVARIRHVTLHDLRRTGCTYMLNANENLMLVSKGIMNHKNVQTTRTYTKPFERELKGIMNRHTDRLMRYVKA
jgi:integrase